jgi:phosphatidylglycerol:prolipoprotein diacylglycerol transferase
VPKFTWNLDPALFHLGSWELRYYSLIFVVVFLGGYQLLRWQVMRGGGEERDASDFFVYGVLAVLIGARLGHCIFYDYEKAMNDPLWILQIWTGGLSSHGAVIGLIVAMWRFTKTRGIPFLEGADRFAFSAALGATLVRIGNFFNSEIVGKATDQSWGVKFPRYIERHGDDIIYRHPTQIYEAALGLAVLGALFLADRALGKERRPRGILISLFFLLYFTGRIFIENFKELQVRSLEEAAGFTMGQMLSAPCALLGLYGVYRSLKEKEPVGWISDLEDEDDEDDEDEDDEDEDEDDEDEDDEDGEDEDDEKATNSEPEADRATDEAAKSSPKRSAKSESKKSGLHDVDVDEEFSRSEEERRRLTREREKDGKD